MISNVLSVLETEEQRVTLSAFYEKHKKRFYAAAYSKLHSHHDSEDAIEEAFMRIAEKPEIFFGKNEDDRLYYALVIIRNVSVDMYKKKAKITLTEPNYETACEPSVIDRVIGDFSRDELIGFIRTLSDARRDALFLKVHYGMSNSEIATALGISETAARKRLSDAGKAIREFVKGKQNE